jgi:D-alanyl-D-alanine carboxypeptidase
VTRRRLVLTALVIVAASGVGLSAAVGRDAGGPTTAVVPTPAVATPTLPPPASATPAATPSPSPTPEPSPTDPPVTPPPTLVVDAAMATKLQAQIERLREKYGVPGISATLILPDGSRWTGTTGLADVKAKEPVTADTAFAIASATKTFTAAVMLALVEDGRIGLDAKVAPHLPNLGIDPRITVRHLLDHTSGLHDYFLHPKIDAALVARKARAWTTARTMRYVGKPYFLPGKGWRYSNTNYLILGLLAESIDGRPLAEQLRERFLVPLELEHTWYQSVEWPRSPLARGYRFIGAAATLPPIDVSDDTVVRPFTSVVTAAAGAGAIASTSADLATWARALYGGSILRAATVDEMIADAARTAALKPRIPYGLGVQVVAIDGRTAIGHSGRLAGFRSVMRWLPDERIAVAVLTNQTRFDPALIARSLLRVVLGKPVPSPAPSDAVASP